MSSRRALGRWGWRAVARDRRQHALMIAVLALTTLFTTIFGFAFWGSGQRGPQTTGSATHALSLRPTAERSISSLVAEAERTFDATDVSLISQPVEPPGTAGQFTLSDRRLDGSFGGAPFRVLDGRAPRAPGELAPTRQGQRVLRALTGAPVGPGETVTLGDLQLRVTGIVEDPSRYDDIAMYVGKGTIRSPAEALVLVSTDDEQLMRFGAGYDDLVFEELGAPSQDAPLAAIGLALSLAALLLVGVLSGVAHATAAQRRLREYGLLAAIGARPKQVSAAVASIALIVGTIGAGAGTIAGTALTLTSDHLIELVIRHDLPPGGPPVLLALLPFVLTLAVSVLAAWRPARALGRMPTGEALSARRPQPSTGHARRRAGTAAILATAVCAVMGAVNEQFLLLSLVPILGLVTLLLWTPSLITLTTRLASRGPLSLRIAARDLLRHRRRSASALGALLVVLAVPMTIATVSASSTKGKRELPPQVPANVVLLEDATVGSAGLSPVHPPSRASERALRRMRELLPGARVARISVAVDPRAPRSTEFGPGHLAYNQVLADQRRSSRRAAPSQWPTWVATPELLAAWGLPASLATHPAGVLATHSEAVRLTGHAGSAFSAREPARLSIPDAASIASVWITPPTVAATGWKASTCCWIVVAPNAIPVSLHPALFAAAGSDLAAVVRTDEEISSAAGAWSLLGGLVLGVLVVLIVLALSRVETERDLGVLSSIGAGRRVLARVGTLQATLLVLPATICALGVGYLTWWATATASTAGYPFVLSPAVLTLVVGLPLLGGACAWLAARRIVPRPGSSRLVLHD